MRILIVFSTTHGCTQKCGIKVANQLKGDIKLVDLDIAPNPELNRYDIIIMGTSVHAGTINQRMVNFVNNNYHTIKMKHIAFYLCFMDTEERAKEILQATFPSPITDKAIAHGYFGGEFDFDKMNELQKYMIEEMINVNQSISKIDYDKINQFSERLNEFIKSHAPAAG